MSEKRYFYSDPTVMPYMAKQFGMRFVDALSGEEFHDWGGYLHCNWNQKNGPSESDDYLFIHPDSLPLLEPAHGDVATYDYVHPTRHMEHRPGQVDFINFRDYYSDAVLTREEFIRGYDEDWARMKNMRIIQRGGKVFHWPESEAA